MILAWHHATWKNDLNRWSNEELTASIKLYYLLKESLHCCANLIPQTNRQLQPTSSLPAASQMPFLSRPFPSQKSNEGKKRWFLLKLSLAPGYSKLQIAADNIARYWNMFDLLTHTAAPLLLHLLLLLLQNSGEHGASTVTKWAQLWRAMGGECVKKKEMCKKTNKRDKQ